MKKIIFSFVALLTASAGYVGYSVYNDMQNPNLENFYLTDVEALATGGESGGEYINCFCSLTTAQVCSTLNKNGSKCAAGENVKCWDYNANCAG